MQSCIRPKLFGQSNLVVALRKIFDTLNEKKKMESMHESGAVTLRTQQEIHEAGIHSQESGADKAPSVCRHANVNTDDDEFIRYVHSSLILLVNFSVRCLLSFF